jgi:hypothetical protein
MKTKRSIILAQEMKEKLSKHIQTNRKYEYESEIMYVIDFFIEELAELKVELDKLKEK